MTNNMLEEYIRTRCCPKWDVRYEAPGPKLDIKNIHIIDRCSLGDQLADLIEKEKKRMHTSLNYAISKRDGVVTLTSKDGGFSTAFIIEHVTTCPDMPVAVAGYIPDIADVNALLYNSKNRTINPKCLGEKLIKNVIFHDPATIVFWDDGTKTVVKAQNGEAYDPEKGLAMAITKKALGNEGNYYNTFAKWLKESEEAEG
jgi:hypothetical protein